MNRASLCGRRLLPCPQSGERPPPGLFKDGDFDAFLKAISHACIEIPVDLFGYCLLPNHFHLVVRPREDGDLSRWMHWLLNAHVRRYHRHYQRSGHLWQGRFKAFPIQEDEHLLTVLRYVERNPVRAKLVRRAEHWLWSSASCWKEELNVERPSWLVDSPVARGGDWLERVNSALTAGELAVVRKSVERGTPLGSPPWQQSMARRLGLESTLRARGRPPKSTEPPEKK